MTGGGLTGTAAGGRTLPALVPGPVDGLPPGIHPVAPGGQGLDWLGQMGLENIAELDAALTGEPALTTFLEAAATEVAAVTPTRVSAELGGLVSEVDQKMISGAFAEFFARALRTSVDSGIA